jgi:hypothetical protein
MKTLYAACLSRLGLSQSEAATLHNTRIDTIKSWSVGRRPVPDGAWAELRAYEMTIVDKSEAIREAWEDAGEIRDVVLGTKGDPINLMAAADFLLSNDAEPPVIVIIKD